MKNFSSLQGKLLIAMPKIKEAPFDHSVCLICQHNEDEAFGFIINQATDMTVADLLADQGLSIDSGTHHQPILTGGPARQGSGFVIHNHQGKWRYNMAVTDSIFLASSMDILSDIAANHIKDHYFIVIGYAAWTAEQLEQELMDNDWLVGEPNDAILFDLPLEKRWQQAIANLGISPLQLTEQSGYA